MTRILLDTCAYSAFLRGHDELTAALQRAEEVCLTPIVLGELLAGFLRGGRAKKNRAELEAFLASPRVRVLAVDEETAERYALVLGALRAAGTPVPTNDVWIAASAMQHGLRLITTDAHFGRIPQILAEVFLP